MCVQKTPFIRKSGVFVSRKQRGARWVRQHFGVSKNPLRPMAWFGPWNPGREPGPPGEKHIDYTGMDITEGGTNIPYWMEDPKVRKKTGSQCSKKKGFQAA